MVSTTDGIKIATATASNLNFADGVTITGDSVSIGGITTQGGAITSVTTLTADDSGTWYTVDQTNTYSILLPFPPTGGIWYKFMIKIAGSGIVTVRVPSPTLYIYGTIINSVTSVIQLSGSNELEFVANVAKVGDTIEVYEIDSTTYMVKCICSTNGGIIDNTD